MENNSTYMTEAMEEFAAALVAKGYWNFVEIGDTGIAFLPDQMRLHTVMPEVMQATHGMFPIELKSKIFVSENLSNFVTCSFKLYRDRVYEAYRVDMRIMNHQLSSVSFVELRQESLPLTIIPTCSQSIRLVNHPLKIQPKEERPEPSRRQQQHRGMR